MVVEGFAQEAGRYQLRVDAAPTTNTGSYQGDIACNSEIPGSLVAQGNYHRYSLSVSVGGLYRVDMCGTLGVASGGLDSDLVIAVYSGNQSLLTSAALIGSADDTTTRCVFVYLCVCACVYVCVLSVGSPTKRNVVV